MHKASSNVPSRVYSTLRMKTLKLRRESAPYVVIVRPHVSLPARALIQLRRQAFVDNNGLVLACGDEICFGM